jgi:hypothetical protein
LVSQRPEQHWLLSVQSALVRRQLEAGTAHRPLTQLFEQHSEFWLHARA